MKGSNAYINRQEFCHAQGLIKLWLMTSSKKQNKSTFARTSGEDVLTLGGLEGCAAKNEPVAPSFHHLHTFFFNFWHSEKFSE